ncbi:beta-glucosidase [Chitinophaga silvatica]|uniref:Beta-glucosidase n=1 Tax=Chitinophaga silvatica TaxID=2282649 RepID=A0A3E1Y2C4_9BACT|nr:glycoside hydrolase family 3 N-terminal domain-containing protein [Chitinophaga silvatica]RFS18814.1 beta-glucosidase [Chitinophaga silvatica]
MQQKFLLAVALLCVQLGHGQQLPAYKNAHLSPDARAKDLLSRMTLQEKIMQTQCLWGQKAQILDAQGNFDPHKAAPVLKNGLGQLARLNERYGPNSTGRHPAEQAALYNAIQHYFIEKTRLGIPVIVHEESLHGQQTQDATNFPVPIALASTWDEALLTEIYSNVAEEIRARGGHQVLAPVIDIVRDPRWGRTEETLGEDPYLTSRLAVATLKGYQGNGTYLAPNKVAATLKHFGIHGQSEGGLNVAPSNIDERTAREVFFKPFEAAVKEGNAMNVMACYNEVFGLPAHINSYLLKDILRKEWGFKGVIVSDYYAVRDVQTLHKITPSLAEAGALAFNAGIEVETPDPDGFKFLEDAVKSGNLKLADLDSAVTHILIAKFRLGLFEHPYVEDAKADEIVGSPTKRAIAYKAAQESMVLLKNDHQVLPWHKENIKTIAFIGPNANKCLLGGYSGTPRVTTSPLQAMRERYGNDIKILYAEGVSLADTDNWFADTVRLVNNTTNKEKIAEAIKIAQQADAVVLFVGEQPTMSREGWASNHLGDLPTLDLLNGQQELISAITALGKPTCAFVNSGPPLAINGLVDAVPALIQCWYLGQESGYAMVDALFGVINPGGKLPISFPRSAGHIPAYYNYKPSARRGYNLGYEVSPLFAFGHGLSYTTFNYSQPVLSKSSINLAETTQVKVTVTNTGKLRGTEVVQLYIRDDYSSVTRPVKELKGFKRIELEPGQSEEVSFSINKAMLSFYDKNMNWIAEPGTFTIMVGTSSDETGSCTLTLNAGKIH